MAENTLSGLLPTSVDRAEYSEPTLLLGGQDWSLSATCAWRWDGVNGCSVDSSSADRADRVWDLVGETIVAVRWIQADDWGSDPILEFRSGGRLCLLSDAPFDTWVWHVPNLVLVGPLLDD